MALVIFLSRQNTKQKRTLAFHFKLLSDRCLEKWLVCMGNIHGNSNHLFVWESSVFIHLPHQTKNAGVGAVPDSSLYRTEHKFGK